MAEIWKSVPGYEGVYEVSDQGRVRSLDRLCPHALHGEARRKGRVLRHAISNGYPSVTLHWGGRAEQWPVYRLVAAAFLGPLPDGLDTCHNDGDRANSRLSNLRYDTRSGNLLDSVKHGTHNSQQKTHCANGHEYTEENTIIIAHRACRICKEHREIRKRKPQYRRPMGRSD
jgi:hypothetical protein